MSLLFMDGFDHYAGADVLNKWDSIGSYSVAISSSYARSNGQGLRCYYSATKPNKSLGVNASTLIVGFAFYLGETGITNSTSTGILYFYDDSTKQIMITVNSSGQIVVYNGDGTLLGTSTNTVSYLHWYYLEAKVSFHETTGTIDIRINGTSWLSLTSKNTINSVNEYANKVMIGAAYYDKYVYFDDLYVCDTTGTKNNDFLGDVRIDTLLPNGAGNYTQWTPSAGSNYQNVDDAIAIDDDATYNSADTIGYKDSYTLTDLDALGTTIHGIQLNTTYRKDDAGTRGVQAFIRTNSTDYDQGDEVSLLDTYTQDQIIIEDNPNDSAAWEEADINALEIGIELIS